MSESTSNQAPHQPGVYVKGDVARVANSASKATALAFDGYVRVADDVTVEQVSNTLETIEPKVEEAPVEVKATPTPRAPRNKPTSEETA